MKLPAVAIAAAFAGGIALGLHPLVAPQVTSRFFLAACFTSSLVLILAGLALAKMDLLFPAATVSLLTWALLGFLGACLAEQPRSPSHVASLLEQRRLSLESPLRWRGRMRDEPAKLPWGYGLEIDLSGVEFQGAALPAQGGLRLSFTPHPEQAPLPELHAGGKKTPTQEIANGAIHARPALFLCRGRGRASSSPPRGAHDHNRFARRILLSPVGATEFSGDCRADPVNCKTRGPARFQFSTDLRGYRLHRRIGCALA